MNIDSWLFETYNFRQITDQLIVVTKWSLGFSSTSNVHIYISHTSKRAHMDWELGSSQRKPKISLLSCFIFTIPAVSKGNSISSYLVLAWMHTLGLIEDGHSASEMQWLVRYICLEPSWTSGWQKSFKNINLNKVSNCKHILNWNSICWV